MVSTYLFIYFMLQPHNLQQFWAILNEYLQSSQFALNIRKDLYNVKRSTRSLLEELNSVSVKKNSEAIIESRATHVIDSAINLLKLIRENYDPEMAYELERRLINSIKGADTSKFIRGIRKFRDKKEIGERLHIVTGDINDD